jgi:hypothetical protein
MAQSLQPQPAILLDKVSDEGSNDNENIFDIRIKSDASVPAHQIDNHHSAYPGAIKKLMNNSQSDTQFLNL